MKWINSLEDMTDEQRKIQILESDKRWIEQIGFNEWLKMENKMYEEFEEGEEHKEQVKMLKSWAEEKGFMKSKYDRMNDDKNAI